MVYLAAICHCHIELGYPNPLVDKLLLAYLCKRMKCHQGTQRRVRLAPDCHPPGRPQAPPQMYVHVRNSQFHTCDEPALWAAISLGFYGPLRGREFTTSSSHKYDPSPHFLVRDVNLAPDRSPLKVTLKASKTDPFRASLTVIVAATHNPTCKSHAVFPEAGPPSPPSLQPPVHPLLGPTYDHINASPTLSGHCSEQQASPESGQHSISAVVCELERRQRLQWQGSRAGPFRCQACGRVTHTATTLGPQNRLS